MARKIKIDLYDGQKYSLHNFLNGFREFIGEKELHLIHSTKDIFYRTTTLHDQEVPVWWLEWLEHEVLDVEFYNSVVNITLEYPKEEK